MRLWHLEPRPLLFRRSHSWPKDAEIRRRLLLFHLLSLALLLCCQPAAAAAVTYQQTAVDALFSFKLSARNPTVLTSWGSGDPCLSSWKGVECANNHTITSLKLSNLKLTGTLSPLLGNLMSLHTLWLDSNSFVGPIPPQLANLRNLTSLRLSNNFLNGSIPESLFNLPSLKELYLSNNSLSGTLPFNAFNELEARVTHIVVDGNNQLCTLRPGYNVPVCGPSLAPSLIFGPMPSVPSSGKDENHVAAIAGGVAGAVVLVVITTLLVFCCLYQAKNWPSATSDTGSSDPSAQVDWIKGPETPSAGGPAMSFPETQVAKVFSLEELEHATKKFSMDNLIGEGGFGFVYKGLLQDGTIVAVKRRSGRATQDFAKEVDMLSQIKHRHLVVLLGFCQENDQQLVVYDYLPNGSVCSHLYDADGVALGKLDFKQRLSIALGAAKGLKHLHNLTPTLIHSDFKTNNVLLDASFESKVTDFGLSRLLSESRFFQEAPAMVSTSAGDGKGGFLDPEYYLTQTLTEKSDVYSFGVFLLELISGREAVCLNRPRPEWSLVEWGRSLLQAGTLDTLVDDSLGANFMEDALRKMVEVGFKCVEEVRERRPAMSEVVADLEEALEKERGLAAGGGDGTNIVTLGSELFT